LRQHDECNGEFQQLTDSIIVPSLPIVNSERFGCLVAATAAALKSGLAQTVLACAAFMIPVITFPRIHLNFISRLLKTCGECIEDEIIHKFLPLIAQRRRKLTNCAATMSMASPLRQHACGPG
jgi:hypothetical protein